MAGPENRRPPLPSAAVLIVIGALCAVIEAVLLLADLGVIPIPRLRWLAYSYGGFWPGLLHGWHPNYPGQPLLMFLTYGFLHGGPLHLAMNMAALVSLGRPVLAAAGSTRFLIIWIAAQLGGGLAYAAISAAPRPMVGASGALFGLAGALLAMTLRERTLAGESPRPVWQAAGVLMLLNLLMAWALGGQLAWQTHLGGFIAGWIAAALFRLGGRPAAEGRT